MRRDVWRASVKCADKVASSRDKKKVTQVLEKKSGALTLWIRLFTMLWLLMVIWMMIRTTRMMMMFCHYHYHWYYHCYYISIIITLVMCMCDQLLSLSSPKLIKICLKDTLSNKTGPNLNLPSWTQLPFLMKWPPNFLYQNPFFLPKKLYCASWTPK